MLFYNPQWSILELLYYLSTPILIIIGVIGLKSLSQAKKEFTYRTKRDSIQRAVELSRFYIREVIPGLEGLFPIIKGSQYEKEILKFDKDKFYNFDWAELFEIIKEKCDVANINDEIAKIHKCLSEILAKKEEVTHPNGGKITVQYVFRLNTLMNNLEYFAMNFNTGLPNEALRRVLGGFLF